MKQLFKRFLAVGAASSVITLLLTPGLAHAYTPTVNEYAITGGSDVYGIAPGPDGNMWFAEVNGDKIGKITPTGTVTEYNTTGGSHPQFITAGPDGKMWFTETNTNKIAKSTLSGAITEYTIPTGGAGPEEIVAGPDGNLWFTEYSGNKIGKITTSGSITEYTVPTGSTLPYGITAGPDGNLWFTEYSGNKIGKITTSGSITEYTVPTPSSGPIGIVNGPDGNIWFAEVYGDKIGKITTTGSFTEYNLPASSGVEWLAVGTDGNIWYNHEFGGKLSYITTSGTTKDFSIIDGGTQMEKIAVDSSGNIWFTELNIDKIGEFILPKPGVSNQSVLAVAGTGKTVNVVNGVTNDPNPATLTIVSGPSHGSASINTTAGTITYTATVGYSGSDSLTYKICSLQDSGACSLAVLAFTVTAINPAAPDTGAGQPSNNGTALFAGAISVILIAAGLTIRKTTKKMIKKLLLSLTALTASLLVFTGTAHAINITWAGNSPGHWNTNADWTGSIIPADGDTAIFGDPDGIVIVNGSVNIQTIRLANNFGSYDFGGIGPLHIFGGITNTGHQNTSISTPLILEGNTDFNMSNGVVNFEGGVSGSGGITLSGSGSGGVYLISAATYTGVTTINSGRFTAGDNDVFPTSSAFILADNSAAILEPGGSSETIASLSGGAASAVRLDGSTLTLGDSTDTTYAGSIIDNGVGGGGIIKQGTGKFTLTGTNTYTGPTIVNAGTFDVNGSIANSSGLTVALGASLKGSGTLPAVTMNGTVAPGNSIGTMNGTSFTFGSGSVLENEINPAGQTDLVNATSSVTINSGATLKIIPAAGTYTPGKTYTIISAPSVTGTFSSVIDTSGLLSYQIKYYPTHVDIVIPANATSVTITKSIADPPNTGFGQPANKPWSIELLALISVATLVAGLTLRRSII